MEIICNKEKNLRWKLENGNEKPWTLSSIAITEKERERKNKNWWRWRRKKNQ